MRNDFPFTILDVAGLLRLPVRSNTAKGMYVDCPFCGKKQGKMILYHAPDNSYRCFRCGKYGGLLYLYGELRNLDTKASYDEITENLRLGKAADYENKFKKMKKVINTRKATPKRIHAVYSALLSILELQPVHKHALMNRGLSLKDIQRFGFRSMPEERYSKVVSKLTRKVGSVKGVPGFFYNKKIGKWDMAPKCNGFLVPVRNHQGMLVGMQIRLDQPDGDAKYLWLSTASKHLGTPSGSPCGFAGSVKDRIGVTEGALKPIVAHCLTGKPFAGVPGANQTESIKGLVHRLHELGVRTIDEAYDMNKFTNKNVQNGLNTLCSEAARLGITVINHNWNPRYNGIDDYYNARRKFTVVPGNKTKYGKDDDNEIRIQVS